MTNSELISDDFIAKIDTLKATQSLITITSINRKGFLIDSLDISDTKLVINISFVPNAAIVIIKNIVNLD